jgi:putative spermidine/putrescine transport system permease protein
MTGDLGAVLRKNLLRIYVLLFVLFLSLPTIVVVGASMTAGEFLSFPPQGLNLRWYHAVLQNNDLLNAVKLSAFLSTIATAISLIIGTMAAYALVRFNLPGAQALSSMMMAPIVFPGIVMGVSLLQLYSILSLYGNFAGLVAAHIFITLPYIFRGVTASLTGVDANLEDAARTLGANGIVAFMLVTLPLIRGGLLSGAIFAFIISFDDVPITLFLLSSQQTTLPVQIFNMVEYGVDPQIAAISSILILVTGLAVLVAEFASGRRS